VSGGGTAVDITIASGGSGVVSAGGSLVVQGSATDSGTLRNSGTITVSDGATLAISAAALVNSGAIVLLGAGSGATVLIENNVTLSGGGSIALADNGHNAIVDNGSPVTLTNLANKISGAGVIGDVNMTLINRTSGVINGNGTSSALILAATSIANSGVLEGTSPQGLVISGGTVTNAKTIEALGSGTVTIADNISGTTSALILASGGGAEVLLDAVTITSGKLQTLSGGVITNFGDNSNVISGGTIVSGSVIEVTSGGTLTLISGTIGAKATVEATDGATILLSGTVKNSGTLLADSGSLVKITSGAIVSGGIAQVDDGVVEIAGPSNEAVSFVLTGSGGLQLDGLNTTYSGRISGFGGSGHGNKNQFIDFTAIAASGASFTYASGNSSNTSGTLAVTDGIHAASVTLVGTYSSGNFSAGTDSSGHLVITDPWVVSGGLVVSGTNHHHHHDQHPPHPDFHDNATLGYAKTDIDKGGKVLSTSHTANLALFGNYMAASFVSGASYGGTGLPSEGQTTSMILSHPHV